jgi:hypothetical protein
MYKKKKKVFVKEVEEKPRKRAWWVERGLPHPMTGKKQSEKQKRILSKFMKKKRKENPDFKPNKEYWDNITEEELEERERKKGMTLSKTLSTYTEEEMKKRMAPARKKLKEMRCASACTKVVEKKRINTYSGPITFSEYDEITQ